PALGQHVTVASQVIRAAAGTAFSGNVGVLTGVQSTTDLADLHGTIHWGDGTSSPATFAAGKRGKVIVQGSHTYDNGGTPNVTVDLTQTLHDASNNTTSPPPLLLPKVNSAARIALPRHHIIHTGGVQITATTSAPFDGTVASITASAPP